MPSIGDQAPDFETVDESGEKFKLSDYRGQKIVLYFYPKDETPGCTAEACSIRDSYTIFQDSDIPIFGVSGGDAKSHIKFKEKYNLPFPLLMDENLEIAELYGAKSRLSILGLGVKRITYLIDEEGKIEAIFGGSEGIEKVKSSQHAEQITSYWGLKL
ncbi:MAG: redoxin domain-containing protein [Candidatus Lokiarchaeota archaeon]|nr:redoxin domain-containing protein [Candidatus Lokiarchaeota archaeon]